MEQVIINLTQHAATTEQQAAGVIELREKGELIQLLTFDDLPSQEEIGDRACKIAGLLFAEIEDLELEKQVTCGSVMVGGAPWLMSALEEVLKDMDIKPLYAFSKRVSVDTIKEDGTVVKSAVFKHLGFVEV